MVRRVIGLIALLLLAVLVVGITPLSPIQQTEDRQGIESARDILGLPTIVEQATTHVHYSTVRGPLPIGNRSEFAAEACMEFVPTGSRPRATVFIDPGHGGADPGATVMVGSTKVTEKVLALVVARRLLPLLIHAGYRVVLSRTEDTSVARLSVPAGNDGLYSVDQEHADLQARIDCANAAHASLLLAIHFDAFYDPSVGGSETLFDDARPFTAQSRRFATLIQQAVLRMLAVAGWRIPDRGVIPDSAGGTPALSLQGAIYGHLLELGPAQPGLVTRPSQMPGALVEPVFLTDPAELAIVRSAKGQQALARAFAVAIGRYFRTEPHRSKTSTAR
jgi:N-acetylmuramoyl-L-alanine amidase